MGNSATRIKALMQALNAGDKNQSALSQWQRVLGSKSEEDVVAGMAAALAQVREIFRQLDARGVPAALYHNALTKVSQTFAPSKSAQSWASLATSFADGQFENLWGWITWVTSDAEEEEEMEPGALAALNASIAEQYKLLRAGGLSSHIHDLLARQLDELSRALRLRQIEGSRPLREAYQHSVAVMMSEVVQTTKDGADPPNENDVEALRKSVGVLRRAADIVKPANDLMKFFADLAHNGQELVSWAQTLLPPP